jgi:hypothetical protein
MLSTHMTRVYHMLLRQVLMTVSTKRESQMDNILLGKHQYHSSH